MDTIVATPIGAEHHALHCSVCGPVGVVDNDVVDLIARDHLANHVGAR